VTDVPSPRWRWRPDADLVADPVPTGDALVVCDAANRVHALDLGTGRLRWSWQAAGPIAAPVAVAGDRVYVSGPRSAVTALDLTSGRACWQVDHRGDWWEREHPPSVTSPPLVVGDLLVYRTAWGMHGLDRDTGASRWWAELFSEAIDADVHSRPVPYGGLLLATREATDNGNAREGSLVAIAPADGSTVWEYQDEEVVEDCPRWLVVPSSPLTAGGRVSVLESNQLRYFGAEDGDPDEPFLATVDAATGQMVGRQALPGSFAGMAAPPVLAAGALWLPQAEPPAGTDAAAPGSGAILAIDQATGELRSQIVLPAPPVAPLLVAGAWLYLFTADRAVQIVDPRTGLLHRRLAVTEDRQPLQTPTISCRLAAGKDWLAVQHGAELALVATA